jgi:mono/diheme cytochrome c family protein
MGRAALWLVAAGLILGTGWSALSARAQELTNPIPATEASVARGRELYGQLCAACHGVQGRGDGPTSGCTWSRATPMRSSSTG